MNKITREEWKILGDAVKAVGEQLINELQKIDCVKTAFLSFITYSNIQVCVHFKATSKGDETYDDNGARMGYKGACRLIEKLASAITSCQESNKHVKISKSYISRNGVVSYYIKPNFK